MSLETFRNRIFKHMTALSAGFDESDDDWMPTLFLENKAGQLTVGLLDGRFLDGEDRKDFLAIHVLPTLAKGAGAIHAAFMTSSWLSKIGPDEEERAKALAANELLPSKDPLAKEALTLMLVSSDQIELWYARILRSLEEPPTLGDWEKGEGPHGRFFGPLQEALRRTGE